ncbi:MAG: outer membrane beta-barrel protein [Bacteroidota bacterium]
MKTLLVLAFTLIIHTTMAQQPVKKNSIQLSVVDSATHQPVTICKVSITENQMQKSYYTDLLGVVKIAFNSDSCLVSITTLGYRNKMFKLNTSQNNSMLTILLSEAPLNLKEVNVIAQKNLIKKEFDRIVYDVQRDPDSRTATLFDILYKIPLLSVDAQDNIQMKGSTSFKVLLNDRPTNLFVNDPKEVFKSLPASAIQKVEVITIPSARYDGEGLAGLINIVMVKKLNAGYTGTLASKYQLPGGLTTNGSLLAKSGKFDINAIGSTALITAPKTSYEIQRNTTTSTLSNLNDQGSSKGKKKSNLLAVETNYEIDTLNYLNLSVNSGISTNKKSGGQTTTFSSSSAASASGYQLNNIFENGLNLKDIEMDYQHLFKANKRHILSVMLKSSLNKNDQDNTVETTSDYPVKDYVQQNQAQGQEQTLQVDYVYPAKGLQLETGVKGIFRENQSKSTYQQSQFEANNTILDYNQNVYAVYQSYRFSLGEIKTVMGTRLENTIINSKQVNSIKKNYLNILTSISLSRSLSAFSDLSLGYSERIERPGVQQLNPFEIRISPNFARKGNPDLMPVKNRSLQLNYSAYKKGFVSIGLSYESAKKIIQSLTQLAEDSISKTSFFNMGKRNNLSSFVALSYPVTKKTSLNLNGLISYVQLSGKHGTQNYTNSGIAGNVSLSANYTLNKTLKTGVRAGYFSRGINLQGSSNGYAYSTFTVSKDFMERRFSVVAAINDPFMTYRKQSTLISTAAFTQNSYYQTIARSASINVSYRFGKLKESKRKRKSIVNDDLKPMNNN